MQMPQPLIRYGANAGKPRPLADVLLDRLYAVKTVLCRLKHAGYSPVRVDLDGARPTIEVEPHHDFATLVADNIACYYLHRHGQRVGQWLYEGVRIVWTEDTH